jgi:hypothetical protein
MKGRSRAGGGSIRGRRPLPPHRGVTIGKPGAQRFIDAPSDDAPIFDFNFCHVGQPHTQEDYARVDAQYCKSLLLLLQREKKTLERIVKRKAPASERGAFLS